MEPFNVLRATRATVANLIARKLMRQAQVKAISGKNTVDSLQSDVSTINYFGVYAHTGAFALD